MSLLYCERDCETSGVRGKPPNWSINNNFKYNSVYTKNKKKKMVTSINRRTIIKSPQNSFIGRVLIGTKQ